MARGNPLKEEHGVFEARIRSAMSMAGHPRMRISTIEADLGINYTRDLLPVLMKRAPTADFVWIMGADNLTGFHRWGGWSQIARTLPIAIIARPNAGPKARLSKFARSFASARLDEAAAKGLASMPAPAWTFLTARWHPASSTALRRRARKRNPFRRTPDAE